MQSVTFYLLLGQFVSFVIPIILSNKLMFVESKLKIEFNKINPIECLPAIFIFFFVYLEEKIFPPFISILYSYTLTHILNWIFTTKKI